MELPGFCYTCRALPALAPAEDAEDQLGVQDVPVFQVSWGG